MDDDGAGLRSALIGMREIPERKPLNMKFALSVVYQVDLYPDAGLSAKVSLMDHPVRARQLGSVAGLGKSDRE